MGSCVGSGGGFVCGCGFVYRACVRVLDRLCVRISVRVWMCV